jgi:hypothetical protein
MNLFMQEGKSFSSPFKFAWGIRFEADRQPEKIIVIPTKILDFENPPEALPPDSIMGKLYCPERSGL